jgi:acyl-CoA hydrolase
VPILQGDLVEVVARVVEVGRSSMRVRVEVRKESPIDGTSELCTVGHFTMVAMGADRRPTPVPPEGS